jgi:hypothetical protein
MTESATAPRGQAGSLRLAAIGAAAFTVLFVLHRIGQWPGPDNASPTSVAEYQVSHRGTLLASEVAVGLALLAFIAVLAGLVPVLWKAGQEPPAIAVLVSGVLFIAMGFVSSAAETALVNVGDSKQPAAVLALDQLQGRVPVVFTITALTASVSWTILRTRLLWRWLGIAGLAASAVFLLGSVFSVLGSTPEANSSLIGVGLFIAWMLLLSAALFRAAAARSADHEPPGQMR